MSTPSINRSSSSAPGYVTADECPDTPAFESRSRTSSGGLLDGLTQMPTPSREAKLPIELFREVATHLADFSVDNSDFIYNDRQATNVLNLAGTSHGLKNLLKSETDSLHLTKRAKGAKTFEEVKNVLNDIQQIQEVALRSAPLYESISRQQIRTMNPHDQLEVSNLVLNACKPLPANDKAEVLSTLVFENRGMSRTENVRTTVFKRLLDECEQLSPEHRKNMLIHLRRGVVKLPDEADRKDALERINMMSNANI